MRVLSLIFTFIISATILLASSSVQAWWSQGHMLVAQIAKLNMDQHTIDVVDAHFAYLNQIGPFPQSVDMVTGASWADDIKTFGLVAPSPWHFVNSPLILDGYNYPNATCPIQSDNAASLLQGFIYGVTEKDAPHKPITNGWTNAFATAFVVHLSGDLSQPLHNDDMFNADFPKGDLGGNRINVVFPGQPDVKNLHAVWDSVCGKYVNGFNRPLSVSDRAALVKLAQSLNDTYPLTEQEASMTDAWDMHNEAFEIAKTVAYPWAHTDKETINQTYIDLCIPVAEKQLVRAGIRLARNLKYMFRTYTEVPNYLGELNSRVAGSNNNNNEGWNSKSTGGLIGGLGLGIVLTVIFFYVTNNNKDKKKAGIMNNNNNNGQGYTNVNEHGSNNFYGSGNSMRNAGAAV